MAKRIQNAVRGRRVCFLTALQLLPPLPTSAELIEAVLSNATAKKKEGKERDLLPHIGNEQMCLEIRRCYLWQLPVRFGLCALQSGNRVGAAIVFLTDTPLLLSQINAGMEQVLENDCNYLVSEAQDEYWTV